MTTSILTRRYVAADRTEWNNFVDNAKNSTFLFRREYVDYHQHRFRDHSILIYFDDKLSALLIANETGDQIESHGGLTYGGLILEPAVRLERVLQFFYHAMRYYNSNGFKSILYKCLPSYLATSPANEDLYAMFLMNAKLVRRDTSMVLDKIEGKNKGSLKIVSSQKPERFWNEILIPNLKERHGAEPVHTLSEMELLMERFPENIQLFEAYDKELIAGAVIYVTPTAAHLQYISSNQTGRDADASDILINYLLKNVYQGKKYFSFGTSNTDGGRKLNKGLIFWKEDFGARTFVHDFYEVQTDSFALLSDYD